LWAAVSAQAQIVFTYTGQVMSNKLGFTAGSSFTYSLTLQDFAPTMPESYLSSTAPGYGSVQWYDKDIWNVITGTGITGSYSTDLTSGNISRMVINASYSQTQLTLTTSVYTGSSLFINGLEVRSIEFNNVFNGFTVYPLPITNGQLVDAPGPVSFVESETGTYARSTEFSYFGRIEAMTSSGLDYVDLNTSTVSISIVPEPATFGSWMAMAILGCVVFFRRRCSR
jgi:hypothetical protein